MPAQPVIAVIDFGKTNKKIVLFNQQYELVFEQTARFAEIIDEDGFPCENVETLRTAILDSLRTVFQEKSVAIKAVNVAAYGASFVNIDAGGAPVTPLYNYLKPFPGHLQQTLYEKHGGEKAFAITTASPALGSLNSGLQLYRIKQEQPQLFQKIAWALHLPQYLSYLITGRPLSGITSIGCHTALWDFEKAGYHQWVADEGILEKLPPIYPTNKVAATSASNNGKCFFGVGVHDSSAALIPYRVHFHEPFVLISTGTWCISLNPFDATPLTAEELQQDCLCYLDYKGRPVKAARLFLGPQYDAGVARLCAHFNQSSGRYHSVRFDASFVKRSQENRTWAFFPLAAGQEKVLFAEYDLNVFENDVEAYHALLFYLLKQQQQSTRLVLKNKNVKRIFVDGGFSKNEVYMNLLAAFFPEQEVYAAAMAQGTALGAALAIHEGWNNNAIPSRMLDLKYYACTDALT